MAKQTQEPVKPLEGNQVQVNQGNIDILTVKLMADIVYHLKRIADALEGKK
jgi:hypothetical protein